MLILKMRLRKVFNFQKKINEVQYVNLFGVVHISCVWLSRCS